MTQTAAQLDAIADCEARIGTAFARIGDAIATLQTRTPPTAPGDGLATGALEAERAANAALSERVRLLGEKQQTAVAALERRLAEAGAELARLRRLNRDLLEANHVLLGAEGDLNGPLADMALRAELAALRAERRLELVEIAAIVAAIGPLTGGAPPSDLPEARPDVPEAPSDLPEAPSDLPEEGADHA